MFREQQLTVAEFSLSYMQLRVLRHVTDILL